MKNIKLLIILLITICFYRVSYGLDSIAYYYNLLPKEIFENYDKSPEGEHIKYTFFSDLGTLKTNAIDRSIIIPIIDDKNMFMRIADTSNNGAQASGDMQEVAVFTQNNRIIYIATSIFHFGYSYGHAFYIHIYKYENHKLNEVTSKVLPQINIREFFDADVNMSKINNIISKKGKPVYAYNLPRYGTTIKVNAFPSTTFITEDDSVEVVDNFNYFIKNLKYEIELTWDENNGNFKIGKKIKNTKKPDTRELSEYLN